MKKDNNQILDNLINKLCIESNFYYIKNNDICNLCNEYNKLFIKSECLNKDHKICITCVSNIKTFSKYNIYNIYNLIDDINCNYNYHILLSINILNYNLDEYISFIKLIYSYNKFIKENYIFYLNLDCYYNNLIKKSKYLTFLLTKISKSNRKILIYNLIKKYISKLDEYLDISCSDTYLMYKNINKN